jgi:hypothetical protein
LSVERSEVPTRLFARTDTKGFFDMAMRNDQVPTDCAAVTPSDTADNSFVGLYVGGAGDVAVKSEAGGSGGAAVVFKAVPAGTILPIRTCRVMNTNTTATNITGFIP